MVHHKALYMHYNKNSVKILVSDQYIAVLLKTARLGTRRELVSKP